MANILETIAEKTRERIAQRKEALPLSELRRQAEALCRASQNQKPGGAGSEHAHRFREALRVPGLSFICEVKKASPSKGVIAEDFPYLQIAREYEAAGAAAISCLTEPYWFLGKDEYLKEIAAAVQIPVLRKDFVIDEYMIYEARCLGASAVLLICALLSESELTAYKAVADELGLDALFEAHDEAELACALRCGADIIGVNNRNLKDFSVDIGLSGRLRALAPRDTVFVSESGIFGPEQIAKLRASGTDAVLIGESLMRAPDKRAMLAYLSGGQL